MPSPESQFGPNQREQLPATGDDCALSGVSGPSVRVELGKTPVDRSLFVVNQILEGGYAPHLAVNGVKFLPFEHRSFEPGSTNERFVRFLRNNEIGSVMIADTSPTDQITSLVSELARQGLTIHFRDHHSPAPGVASHETLRRNISVIESLVRKSGGTFRWETRDEYPTCSMLVEEGDLLKLRVGAYICAPCDLDGLGTYLKGLGLRYDSFPGSAHGMELDIAMIDSPQARKTRQMLSELRRQREGSDVEFQHQMLPASSAYLLAYGGVALNPTKLKHNTFRLNHAFVQSVIKGDLDSPEGDTIRAMGEITRSYDRVLRTLIHQYAIVNGPIVVVNLANLSLEGDVRRVLTEAHPEERPDELCKLASSLIGKRSCRVHTGRVKQLIRDICQGEWKMSSDLVVSLITADARKTWQCHVEGIGAYSRINFAALNKRAMMPVFRTTLGSRALVSGAQISKAMSLIEEEVSTMEVSRRQSPRN